MAGVGEKGDVWSRKSPFLGLLAPLGLRRPSLGESGGSLLPGRSWGGAEGREERSLRVLGKLPAVLPRRLWQSRQNRKTSPTAWMERPEEVPRKREGHSWGVGGGLGRHFKEKSFPALQFHSLSKEIPSRGLSVPASPSIHPSMQSLSESIPSQFPSAVWRQSLRVDQPSVGW